MRPAKTLAFVAFITVSLSGCSVFHRQPPPQAPALQTGQGAIEEEQKKEQQGPPDAPLPQPSAESAPPQLPPPPPPKVKKVRKKPTLAQTAPPAVPAGTEQAAVHPVAGANSPVANSPIGDLTTGDAAAGQQMKHHTTNLIAQTEQGLAAIKRPLSQEQQTTEEEIRTFLKQAKVALDNGDSDGAHTLATKAKLLLDELTKQ
jgi:hypothetical protein